MQEQDITRTRGSVAASGFATIRSSTGQVAQLVERGPEKAGVGGSIPSLATTKSTTYKSSQGYGCSELFQKSAGARRVCQPKGHASVIWN